MHTNIDLVSGLDSAQILDLTSDVFVRSVRFIKDIATGCFSMIQNFCNSNPEAQARNQWYRGITHARAIIPRSEDIETMCKPSMRTSRTLSLFGRSEIKIPPLSSSIRFQSTFGFARDVRTISFLLPSLALNRVISYWSKRMASSLMREPSILIDTNV